MRLPRFTLVREEPEAERTFGRLFMLRSNGASEIVCETLEPGDADVKAPRVPPGFYLLEPHGWAPDSVVRFRQTWALVGHDVSHFPEPGVRRSAILFHAGNRDRDTRGCILVGMTRGVVGGEPGVLDSRVAMERLRDLIGGGRPAYLTIAGG